MKIDKVRESLLEQLKKNPIVEVACQKCNIARGTYYRWRKEDPDFMKASDAAVMEGSLLINDMAESQLISAIRDKNLGAITYWLKHHHPTYANRLEIVARAKESESLTPEQERILEKALKLSLFNSKENGGGYLK